MMANHQDCGNCRLKSMVGHCAGPSDVPAWCDAARPCEAMWCGLVVVLFVLSAQAVVTLGSLNQYKYHSKADPYANSGYLQVNATTGASLYVFCIIWCLCCA